MNGIDFEDFTIIKSTEIGHIIGHKTLVTSSPIDLYFFFKLPQLPEEEVQDNNLINKNNHTNLQSHF